MCFGYGYACRLRIQNYGIHDSGAGVVVGAAAIIAIPIAHPQSETTPMKAYFSKFGQMTLHWDWGIVVCSSNTYMCIYPYHSSFFDTLKGEKMDSLIIMIKRVVDFILYEFFM